MKITQTSFFSMFFGLCMVCATAPAHADAAVCATPDGYVFDGTRLQRGGGDNGTGGKGIGGTGQRAANTKGLGGTGSKIAETKGIGGTGNKIAETKGIGGTGNKVAAGSGNGGKGIGGTGSRIAMRGTITGFASICVNGAEVHYDNKTPMSLDGKSISADALKVGQVVSVVADPAPQGGFVARTISVTPAIVGPVDAVNPQTRTIHVMGQDVRIQPAGGAAPTIVPGDTVRISGLRDAGNVVVATLVEQVPASTPAQVNLDAHVDVAAAGRVSLEGYVHEIPDEGRLHIDGHTVILPEHTAAEDIAANERVFVYGVPDDAGIIHADSIAVEDHVVPTGIPEGVLPQHEDHGQPEHEDHEDHEDHEEHGGIEQEDHEQHEAIEQEFEGGEHETPEVEGPEMEGPEIESPEIETPEIETPEIETPEVEVPEVEVPEVETPEIEVPEVEVPEVETPEVEVPEVEVPEIE